MKIQRITTDNSGYKIISACKEINIKARKPMQIKHTFFDYANGMLREFCRSGYTAHNVVSFKHALIVIKSI